MAPSDPSLRHVGRVVDPEAREEGDTDVEPVVELEAENPSADPEPGTPGAPSSGGLLRGERLRARLLERAESARRAGESPAAASDAEGEPSYGDLDEIGRASPEESPGLPAKPHASRAALLGVGARLSPNWIAVFGTLLGVASVVSLLALVMNLDPRSETLLATPSAAPVASAAPSAAPAPEIAKPKRARTKLPGPWRIADAKDAATRVVEGKIGTSSFLKALESSGVPLKEAYRVIASMKGIRNFDRCSSSDRFVAMLDRTSSRLKAFEYEVSAEEVYQSREDASGLLRGSRLDLKVEKTQVSGAFALKGKGVDEAAELAGLEDGLARVIAKALDGHMGLDELEYGDRIRVVVQELSVLGEFARYTGIEALEVKPADLARTPLRIYYFDGGEERGYYDGEGRSPYQGGWRKPIKDARVSSPFNPKRMHPVLKKVMPHNGVDLASPTGTPVGAASSGTVSFVGYGGPSGNLVKVLHDNDIETGYAHLSRFVEGIKVGDKVKRLQVIGYVGSTGRSTGPHLHFSASKKGAFFDPLSLNLDSLRTLSKGSRDAFLEVKRRYDAALDRIPLPPPVEPMLPVAPLSSAVAAVPDAPPPNSAEETAGMGDGEEEVEMPAPAAVAAPAPAAAKPAGASAVHLTDKELLELQGASDDGEVEE